MPDRSPTRTTPLLRAAAVVAATLVLLAASLLPAQAPTASADGRSCEALALEPVDGGRYNVQNNRFGVGAEQCVTARAGGFTVDAADGEIAPGGPPKSYPSIVAGCHWGRCSSTPGLPVRASEVGGARTAVSITRAPGSWNAAYDLWFNSTPEPGGQNDGTEIMIWIDASDAPDPIGAVVGTVDVAGASWQVWQGNIGWDVVSFVREQGATTVDLPLAPFVDEAIARGATEPDDWMTSVQFGFEPWSGGEGLAARGFSFEPGSAGGADQDGAGQDGADQGGADQDGAAPQDGDADDDAPDDALGRTTTGDDATAQEDSEDPDAEDPDAEDPDAGRADGGDPAAGDDGAEGGTGPGGDGRVRSTTGVGQQDGEVDAASTARPPPPVTSRPSADPAPAPPSTPAAAAPSPSPSPAAPIAAAPERPTPRLPAVDPALMVHGPTGTCLDARGAGTADDPQVALWSCDPSQGWTPTGGTLVQDWTGACLGTVAGAEAAGTAVQLQVCDDHPSQRWQPTRSGALLNAASGLCLGPRSGGTAQGTAVVLVRCASAPPWS